MLWEFDWNIHFSSYLCSKRSPCNLFWACCVSRPRRSTIAVSKMAPISMWQMFCLDLQYLVWYLNICTVIFLLPFSLTTAILQPCLKPGSIASTLQPVTGGVRRRRRKFFENTCTDSRSAFLVSSVLEIKCIGTSRSKLLVMNANVLVSTIFLWYVASRS